MKDIFGNEIIKNVKKEISIDGLSYIPNWISIEQHDEYLRCIDSLEWETTLKRRVQQYGYKYDYRKAANMVMSHKDNYIGELPDFLQNIANRLYEEKIFSELPDEVLINEYLPGQGIANHVDCLPCFGETICCISLGSQCVMDFKKDNEIINKYLEVNSLLVFTDEARYKWSHGIRQNKSDLFNGKWINRKRRVSITFRKTII
jgi:alkylated DNA repair dioxygenase AlkB